MNRLNFVLKNKLVRTQKILIFFMALVTITFYILVTDVNSYAQVVPKYAYIDYKCPGSFLGIRTQWTQYNSGSRRVSEGQILSSGAKALFVAGGDNNIAYIGFRDAAGKPIKNKFVQVGPHSEDTYYSFPCTLSGYSKFAVTWQNETQKMCKNAVAKNQLKPCPRR